MRTAAHHAQERDGAIRTGLEVASAAAQACSHTLARATEAYRAFRAGEIEAAALPDIRDVFPDDELLLAEMGMMTTPGASGEDVLREACSSCHNARLDQSLSRARFRADLVGGSRAEKDVAVRRLQLPTADPLAMPPVRLRRLSAEARARAIEVLQR